MSAAVKLNSALLGKTTMSVGLPDNSISTLTKLFCDHISLINNEVLVEHLEGLPSLKSEVRHVNARWVSLSDMRIYDGYLREELADYGYK
jgi:hypothetical protein